MNPSRNAVIAGVMSYVIWGFMPLLFQAMGRAGPDAWEIMTHRVIWGAIAAGALVLVARQGGEVMTALRSRRTLALLCLSAVLIAINWVIFIWAVNSGRTLETSLGYYITPLISMAAGGMMFRERIDGPSRAAMALAAIGVVVQGFAVGHLPWVSIVLALTFGSYGIVRKRVAADAGPGLFIECLLLLIPALAWVVWLEARGSGHFGATPAATLWLIAGGPLTVAPLALFAWAARRIPLSTMGFLQFVSPTISFSVGVAEGEAFTPLRAASFAFIWAGAGVYAWGAWRRGQRARVEASVI